MSPLAGTNCHQTLLFVLKTDKGKFEDTGHYWYPLNAPSNVTAYKLYLYRRAADSMKHCEKRLPLKSRSFWERGIITHSNNCIRLLAWIILYSTESTPIWTTRVFFSVLLQQTMTNWHKMFTDLLLYAYNVGTHPVRILVLDIYRCF